MNANVGAENDEMVAVKMLLDIGSSDAIWLFENDSVLLPRNNYDDFLEKGFLDMCAGNAQGYSIFK